MKHSEARKLIKDKSKIKYAENDFIFAGLMKRGHFLYKTHLRIYDEPSKIDVVKITNCKELKDE